MLFRLAKRHLLCFTAYTDNGGEYTSKYAYLQISSLQIKNLIL